MFRKILIAGALALAFIVPSSMPAQAKIPPSPLKIFVVGDSISQDCGLPTPGSWCGELDTMLNARGIAHQFGAYAIGGWSCAALWQNGGNGAVFKARIQEFQPNLVIMNCGTNDVPNNQATKDYLGEVWRSMVEYSRSYVGAMILPALIQYSNPEIQDRAGRSWLLPGEKNANDTFFFNWHYYQPYGWFAGTVDFQKIPGDYTYLNDGNDGIHPNKKGRKTMAILVYRALKDFYGWPDDVPEPCGMYGHWREYNQSYFSWIPCE